jgi:uracil-DNA glycosylase
MSRSQPRPAPPEDCRTVERERSDSPTPRNTRTIRAASRGRPKSRAVRLHNRKNAPGKAMTAAATDSLDRLRRESASCRACPLWKNATQTVFGEGPSDAEIILVGEQPGVREDLAGRPFVGPAGLLLDRALAEAGIDRARVYVTNAVKHFKYEPRGKRRLHKRPNAGEIKACRRWILSEIEALAPKLIVALGATAAQSLVGRLVPVENNRGAVLDLASGLRVLITVHPSALLRLPDENDKREAYGAFVRDLSSIPQIVARRTRLEPPDRVVSTG